MRYTVCTRYNGVYQMFDPIKYLTELGLDTATQMRMVLQVKNTSPYTSWDKSDFDTHISKLCEVDHTSDNLQHSKYLFMYVAQTYIQLEKKGDIADFQTVYEYSVQQWNKFFAENEISLKLEDDYEPDPSEQTKSRKGSKSEKAYQIYREMYDKFGNDCRKVVIESYKSELEMSSGGALTYFHNAAKRHRKEFDL